MKLLVTMLTNAIDIFDDLQKASMADCICDNICPESATQEPSQSKMYAEMLQLRDLANWVVAGFEVHGSQHKRVRSSSNGC